MGVDGDFLWVVDVVDYQVAIGACYHIFVSREDGDEHAAVGRILNGESKRAVVAVCIGRIGILAVSFLLHRNAFRQIDHHLVGCDVGQVGLHIDYQVCRAACCHLNVRHADSHIAADIGKCASSFQGHCEVYVSGVVCLAVDI